MLIEKLKDLINTLSKRKISFNEVDELLKYKDHISIFINFYTKSFSTPFKVNGYKEFLKSYFNSSTGEIETYLNKTDLVREYNYLRNHKYWDYVLGNYYKPAVMNTFSVILGINKDYSKDILIHLFTAIVCLMAINLNLIFVSHNSHIFVFSVITFLIIFLYFIYMIGRIILRNKMVYKLDIKNFKIINKYISRFDSFMEIIYLHDEKLFDKILKDDDDCSEMIDNMKNHIDRCELFRNKYVDEIIKQINIIREKVNHVYDLIQFDGYNCNSSFDDLINSVYTMDDTYINLLNRTLNKYQPLIMDICDEFENICNIKDSIDYNKERLSHDISMVNQLIDMIFNKFSIVTHKNHFDNLEINIETLKNVAKMDGYL